MLLFDDNPLFRKEPKDDKPVHTQFSPRCELPKSDSGYVILPADKYNELLRKADAAFNAISLRRRDYHSDKPIEAEIDRHWLYELLMSKLEQQYGKEIRDTYTALNAPDDMYVMDITIARMKPTDEGAGGTE